MSAEEALRTGRLDEALDLLQQQVRKAPADARLRVFLFQLLCVRGEWNRALTQLNVAGELDAGTLLMVQTYREALRCEVYRAEVFAGARTPMVLGQPEEWFALLLQSLALAAQTHHQQAAQLRSQALEQAPAIPGKLNGVSFEWIADGDARIGPCLELILNGRYYWVPLHHIRTIRIEKPADLRDFVWAPVELTWANGGEAVALIPSRYPGTEAAPDTALQLCRRTDWQEPVPGMFYGLGQRAFISDDGTETALLDVRQIDFEPAGNQPATA
jgi:type VI secretion system protein ImpE